MKPVFFLFNHNSVTFGSWYDHVNGWWEKKQTYSNIHYMFYEDLIEVRSSVAGIWIDLTDCSNKALCPSMQDPGQELDRLCSFLGLSPSAHEKESVLTGAKFDNMKKNKMTNYSTVPIMDQGVSPFMRKGRAATPMLNFCLSILNPRESHDSLTLYRKGGRLEEPFHRGPE